MYSNIDVLGFADIWIFLGYSLTICSVFFCLLYGILNWHKGVGEKEGDFREELRWEKEEIELIEKLP